MIPGAILLIDSLHDTLSKDITISVKNDTDKLGFEAMKTENPFCIWCGEIVALFGQYITSISSLSW